MTILIDVVRISGFRGIHNLEMRLSPMTVLIGQNNSGKTSFLKAMQLALGDYGYSLREEDLHIGAGEVRAKEIIVDLRIVPTEASGKRIQEFADEWAAEFGDKIKAEANGFQFVAIRTISKPSLIKGGFETARYVLENWPDVKHWVTEKTKHRFNTRFESIPFFATDAQRDIHAELREKSSFVGKVLSAVDYNTADVTALEEMIAEVNEAAVGKSAELKGLKDHLDRLNKSFHGAGSAEITPLPKKLRDLSKFFSVHFGDSSANSFSMEYHGMGTRSWASLLTVRSFSELLAEKHRKESKPFHSILAVEEPEAHLHPSAQKTLYSQLSVKDGQAIVSTHSPYVASAAKVHDLRYIGKNSVGLKVRSFGRNISPEQFKSIRRNVLLSKGDILFASAVLLFEGQTEDQVVPAMFERYAGVSVNERGIVCACVNGHEYTPFLRVTASLGIPTYVLSDNDQNIKKNVDDQVSRMKSDKDYDFTLFDHAFLASGNDFEAELIDHGLRPEIEAAMVLAAIAEVDNQNEKFRDNYSKAKRREFATLPEEDLLDKMRNGKTSYSGFLADVIRDCPPARTAEALVPDKIRAAFDQLIKWVG
ncbi:MAG: AAA family ATPase [Elusimicrobia bacterium]|nr:AAA family ATPase [Elusimicrobiota bacterium]